MYRLGDKVVCTQILMRLQRVIRGNSADKFWKAHTITPREGIYIGARTLSNGRRDVEDEVGYIYSPETYFRVALVVFSAKENPVYVPLDAIEAAP